MSSTPGKSRMDRMRAQMEEPTGAGAADQGAGTSGEAPKRVSFDAAGSSSQPQQPSAAAPASLDWAAASSSGGGGSGSKGYRSKAFQAATGQGQGAPAMRIGSKISGGASGGSRPGSAQPRSRPTSAARAAVHAPPPGSPGAVSQLADQGMGQEAYMAHRQAVAARVAANRRSVSADVQQRQAVRRSRSSSPRWVPGGEAILHLPPKELRSPASSRHHSRSNSPTPASPGAHPHYAPGTAPTSPGAPASPPPPRFHQSPGHADATRSPESKEAFFHQYKLRQHLEHVPQHTFSQPGLEAAAPIQPKVWSFDPAHPALAADHYMRTKDQDKLLREEADRRARKAARSRSASPGAGTPGRRSPGHPASAGTLITGSPSTRKLRAEVDRMSAARSSGVQQLRQMEDEGSSLRAQSRELQARAMEAIAYAQSASGALGRGGNTPSRPTSAGPPGGSPSSQWFGPGRSAPPLADPVYVAELQARAEQLQAEVDALAVSRSSPGARPSALKRPATAPQASPPTAYPPTDHVSAANNLAQRVFDDRPLADEELKVAAGVFDPDRYKDYQEQMDDEMRRRLEEEKYDSDVEREAEAMSRDPEVVAQQAVEAAQAALEGEAALHAAWAEENRWMDDYRKRLGPSSGYHPMDNIEQVVQIGGREYTTPVYAPGPEEAAALRAAAALGPEEQQLADQPYVPVLPDEVGVYAFSDDEGGQQRRAYYGSVSPGGGPESGYHSEGGGGSRQGRRTQWRSTTPRPFTFEERAKARPKTIQQVKLEQDLAIKAQEEAAARNYKFKANPIPKSTLDVGRYERVLIEQEMKREIVHMHSVELLKAGEKPFSFYERDAARKAQREEEARRAKDPNRFQRPFRANAVPSAVHGEKYKQMMADLEAKRAVWKAQAAATAARVEQNRREAEARRAESAKKVYEDKLRSPNPIYHQKYDTTPLGTVPDFDRLHADWNMRLTVAKAANRQRVTVPTEFALNGRTAEEAAAQAAKKEERRRRIILDMKMDEELLTENRWPFKSPRAKVYPTPPPNFDAEPDLRVATTKSATKRMQATAEANRRGRSREEKERVARAEAQKAAQRRAATWTKLQQEIVRQKMQGGGAGGGMPPPMPDTHRGLDQPSPQPGATGGTLGGGFDYVGTPATGGYGPLGGQSIVSPAPGGYDSLPGTAGVRERREQLSMRSDNPAGYIEARHAQIEREGHAIVEDLLLKTGGLDALRYVEEGDGARRGRGR